MVAQGSSNSRADTRVYEVAHNAFRLATTRLVDATEKLEPSVLQGIIGRMSRPLLKFGDGPGSSRHATLAVSHVGVTASM